MLPLTCERFSLTLQTVSLNLRTFFPQPANMLPLTCESFPSTCESFSLNLRTREYKSSAHICRVEGKLSLTRLSSEIALNAGGDVSEDFRFALGQGIAAEVLGELC